MNRNKNLMNLSLLLLGLCTSSNAENIAVVPKTGQTPTKPVSGLTNSDGRLQKGKAWPNNRFVIDTTGNCITDKLTGLMFVKDLNNVNNGITLNWDFALTLAKTGTWCGYDDWRIPNINELRSLINYGYENQANWLMYGSGNSSSPNCNGTCFSNIPLITKYWSSSSVANTSSDKWVIWVDGGNVEPSSTNHSGGFRLFPVRGGQ